MCPRLLYPRRDDGRLPHRLRRVYRGRGVLALTPPTPFPIGEGGARPVLRIYFIHTLLATGRFVGAICGRPRSSPSSTHAIISQGMAWIAAVRGICAPPLYSCVLGT